MAHPRHDLDPAFQTPLRFSLVAALGRDTEVDFGTLREILEASDSALSKAVAHLEGAGYLKVTKGYIGNRPRTWVRLTAKGEKAFQWHIQALRSITGTHE